MTSVLVLLVLFSFFKARLALNQLFLLLDFIIVVHTFQNIGRHTEHFIATLRNSVAHVGGHFRRCIDVNVGDTVESGALLATLN